MKKKTIVRSASCLLMIGGMALAGCTDSNYDLSNLNKTIAIGSENGLVLPGHNSTSEMVLDDILDIDDSDVIKTNEAGNYYFSKGADKDEVDSANPVVDEIELKTVANESDYDFDVAGSSEARRAGATDIPDGAKEIFSFTFEKVEDLENLDVMGISLAELKAGINVDFTFTDELKAKIGNLKKIILDLPTFFDLEVESNYESGKNVMTFDKENNIITFTNLTEEGVHVMLKLNGLNFPPIDPDKPFEEMVTLIADEYGYYLYFTPERVSVYGGILFNAIYEEDAATARAQEESQQHENLLIHCHSQIDDTILLTSATGHFNPEISLGEEGKPVGSFTVDNLPEFLDDPDVHLNVANPEVRIWVSSNMDIKGMITDASITATNSKGKEVTVKLDTESYPLYIDPNTEVGEDGKPKGETTTTIIITDHPFLGTPEPNTYYGMTTSEKKLSDLLYDIPKEVSFDCSVVADTTYEGTIHLGYKDKEKKEGWYTIQPSYEFYAPLAFNKGSVIVYRDSITDWHEDLEDISLSKEAKVVLTAEVVNEMPLDMKMHAEALELNGDDSWKTMDKNQINVTITDLNDQDLLVKAGTPDAPVVTPFKIVIEQKDTEGFKHIDGITYNATALAPEDSSLQGITLNNKKQTMKVQNIGVTLFGKVIVDLDD